MKQIFFILILITSKVLGQSNSNVQMTEFAQSAIQWTGIAISKNDRVFVNFPRWTTDKHISVAEVKNGNIVPYPTEKWNTENNETHFICVQSVFIDTQDYLWVLDTGYELETDSTKGGILYCFDLTTDSLKEKYDFPVSIISGKSYLNDFRVDYKNSFIFLTDSQEGGIVTLNLRTREVKRVLAQHPSTLTEVEKITIEGRERKHPVHSDGIELDAKKGYLYYCALMGKNIYRIKINKLINNNIADAIRGKFVEKFATTGANDGIIFDKHFNLYLSSLEKNAISKVNTKGKLSTVITDEKIKWADSFAFDSNGNLYFTISQIHLPKEQRGLYKIFKLVL